MSQWSRHRTKQWIADQAQAAHVPSFPLREPAEQLASPQLAHRHFYRSLEIDGRTVKMPGPPFGLHTEALGALSKEVELSFPRKREPRESVERLPLGPRLRGGDEYKSASSPHQPADRAAGPMPLSGVRVLDFSWVIAGPTATRYLAAMGAEIIKIEAPGRGDPGRTSQLHTVLGQAKRGIVLDLKKPEGVAVATALAAKSDVLIENFATGVMDRLGLGEECAANDQPQPDLRVGVRPRPYRAGSARGRLRYPIAMLCRFCWAQSPSQSSHRASALLGSTRCVV